MNNENESLEQPSLEQSSPLMNVPSVSSGNSSKQDYVIVEYVSDWMKMRGDTELEKRLNSYLTQNFIGEWQMPDDECLSEAKDIIKIVNDYLSGGI